MWPHFFFESHMNKTRSTTILAVMHNNQVAIGGDGQATMGNTIAKSNVRKIRKLQEGKVLTGFAGSTADAFTLLDRFEEKLNAYGGNMKRAAIELATGGTAQPYVGTGGGGSTSELPWRDKDKNFNKRTAIKRH